MGLIIRPSEIVAESAAQNVPARWASIAEPTVDHALTRVAMSCRRFAPPCQYEKWQIHLTGGVQFHPQLRNPGLKWLTSLIAIRSGNSLRNSVTANGWG